MHSTKRLEAMISRTYALALQALDNEIDPALAEEVSGESAEFLALLNGNYGAFGDDACIDPELVALVKKIQTL
jgi:hypothetical protein